MLSVSTSTSAMATLRSGIDLGCLHMGCLDQLMGRQWVGARNTWPRTPSTYIQVSFAPDFAGLKATMQAQSLRPGVEKWTATSFVPSRGAVSMGLNLSWWIFSMPGFPFSLALIRLDETATVVLHVDDSLIVGVCGDF